MKHLLTFISFFIVVSLTTPHFVFADEQAQAVEIDLFIKSRPTKIDRSPDFAEVEAWYDSGSMLMTAAHAAAANETAEDTTVTQKPTAVHKAGMVRWKAAM